MVPSLFVIFISGWGSHTDTEDNLFTGSTPFLDQILQSYPTIMLASEKKEASFESIYKKIGANGELSKILSEQGVRQKKIAGPDRYGLLTEVFNQSENSYEKEEWAFINYPHGHTLKDNHDLELNGMMKALDLQLRSKRGAVTFASIAQLWALGLYNDPRLLLQGVHSLSKYLQSFIDNALQEGARVLLVSDSSLAESCKEVFTNEKLTKTESPLPCVLIHPSVDGLRAADHDYASERAMQMRVAGTLEDIAPTVLALMDIPQPESMPGKNIFDQLSERTL